MKKKRSPGGTVLGVCVALFLICAVTAIAIDNMILGLSSLAILFAAIILALIAESADRRREQKRRVKYGGDSPLRLDILCLPDDAGKLAAAYELLSGTDKPLPSGITSGRELADRLAAEGLLLRLGYPFTVSRLADGVSSLLRKQKTGSLEKITGADITALDNKFVRNRRADGVVTANSDINTAAYLLRQAYLEPLVIVYSKPSEADDGTADNTAGTALNIAAVPMERAHDLYALLRSGDGGNQTERGDTQ